MKTLEEEAEDAADDYLLDSVFVFENLKNSFIAGVNSNYVEAQIVQAQIDVLESIGQNHSETYLSQKLRDKINELKERLIKLSK